MPCYNEQEMLPRFVEVTNSVIASLPQYSFRYILVNDGSRDGTYLIMKKLAQQFDNIKYISFSRNFGKEAAMYAGLKYSTADYVVVMDADLQHPPTMFGQFLQGMKEGFDCCAAMRTDRKGESKVRSFFSLTFYKLSNKITEVSMPYGAVDYRMMTRQMVDSILELCEVQRFSKGIFCWVGFNTKWIPYENVERELGTSKWSFFGLFKYAIDGITSFSVAPLRFLAVMGSVISAVAFVYILVTLVKTLFFGIDVPGYVTRLCATLFLGGITELSIGILGEYISRIYLEVKKRPIFIVQHTNFEEKNGGEERKDREF